MPVYSPLPHHAPTPRSLPSPSHKTDPTPHPHPTPSPNTHTRVHSNAELSLGRSQGCDVVIGYRTVSTRHATVSYSRGEFHYQDARSSNGSLLYLRGPLEIPTSRPVRLRMGRSILALRARQSLQLAALPRRAAADVWRWLTGGSSSGSNGGGRDRDRDERRAAGAEGGSGVSGGASVSPGGHQTGLDVLRDLHMGRFQQPDDGFGGSSSLYLGGDSSLVSRSDAGTHHHGPARCLRTEASGEGRGLLFHLEDSSSSSLAADSGSGAGGGGGGAQPRRGGGGGAGAGNREWSTRENVLHLASGAGGGGPGSSAGAGGEGEGEGEGESKASSRDGSGGKGQDSAAGGGEQGGGEEEEEVPPFQPSLALSDLVSAPSRHVALQRTKSSRV